MIDRRKFLGLAAGAGAGLTLTPQLLRALEQSGANPDLLQAFQQQGGKLMQRAIPSSGEMIPVISYAPRSAVDVGIKEIIKTFLDNGGRVIDVLHGGPGAEGAARRAAGELGIQNRFFWTTPLINPAMPGTAAAAKADPAAVRQSIEEKLSILKVPKFDLVMVGSYGDVPTQLAVLREMKKEGKVRYIGLHHLAFPPNAPMPAFGNIESIMRNEQIDFVGTDYSVGDRRVEETILPLAMERKIGFMAYFALDRGRIFKRIGSTPLPEWAAEFDAKTWAQFCLKYVLSHPAVVVAREGTTNAAHLLDNIGGGIGRLPNEATRKRMAALVDSLPPTPPPGPPPTVVLSPAVLDRYVGEYKAPSGFTAIFRREGTTLFVKPGNNPETALIARGEIRFQDPRGPVFEFDIDIQGRVIAVMLEQGANFMRLARQ